MARSERRWRQARDAFRLALDRLARRAVPVRVKRDPHVAAFLDAVGAYGELARTLDAIDDPVARQALRLTPGERLAGRTGGLEKRRRLARRAMFRAADALIEQRIALDPTWFKEA